MQPSSTSAIAPRHQYPAVPDAVPASANDANQLGIRILGLKSIPVENCSRLMAFLACASTLQHMPMHFVPLLEGELRAASATLPKLQQRYASNALDSVAPPRS